MCTFISLFLAASVDRAAMARVAEAHGLALSAQENAAVSRQLQEGEALYLSTKGHCDCGTALGSQVRGSGGPSRSDAAARLRAKGWSEAKIARSLAQSEEHELARSRQAQANSAAELERWYEFLGAATARGNAPYVGLLIHDYRGPLSEDMQLKPRQSVALRSVSAAFLAQIEHDRPYVFGA